MQLELPTDRPRMLELSGTEVLTALPKLKADGAFVLRMDAVRLGRWRLFIAWPANAHGSRHSDDKPVAPSRVEAITSAPAGRQAGPAEAKGIFFLRGFRAGTESFHPIHSESKKTFAPQV